MDFNPLSITGDGTAIFGKDESLLVKFVRHAELSQYKSKAQGMPIYDDVDMIEVIQPGEKDATRVLADEFHKRRFPRQWEAYQKGIAQSESGTPLDHLFPNEPGTILNLKTFNVYTVQQLAGLSDTAMINIPMGRTLSDKAKAYLSSASGGQNFHAMQEAMMKRINELEARLSDKGETVSPMAPLNLPDEPQSEARRGPGRPRKDQAAA